LNLEFPSAGGEERSEGMGKEDGTTFNPPLNPLRWRGLLRSVNKKLCGVIYRGLATGTADAAAGDGDVIRVGAVGVDAVTACP
jgi:hypothetical protein